jgi:hypothetical protein
MARSTRIYAVMDENHLRAAFTVKHELVTWLHTQTDKGGLLPFTWGIIVVPDGCAADDDPTYLHWSDIR